MINRIIENVNEVLWGEWQVLVYLLIIAGVWFTIRLGAIQVRHFGHMFRLIRKSHHADNSGISSYQALCTSLSARIGSGNLAGVAIAISLGGSGAVFWMWVIALLGMATGFAESTLAQVYKVRDSHGEFRGGPAYYIEQGLNSRALAVAFALCLFLGYGLFFSAMQANTIADALNNAYQIPTYGTGLVITVVAGCIVAGGLRAIARFAELMVPVMSVSFIVSAFAVTLFNIAAVPAILLDIVASAFGLREAGAGAIGAAIQNGIRRGLYSNEAGSGSAPHAAASASPNPNHPASQGYIQMLGVFFDTIVLCTCTAIIILLAGGASSAGEMEGISLTQNAMSSHIGGYGVHFVSAAISLFAFTSVVANYAYAESNLRVFKLDSKPGRIAFTIAYLSMVLWGSGAALQTVWNAADMALGLMTVVNVVALALLTPTIVAVSKDYFKKHDQGLDMEFKKGDCKVQGQTEDGIWN